MVVPHKTSWFKTGAIYLGVLLSLWSLGKGIVLGIASFEQTYINFGVKIDKVVEKQNNQDTKIDKVVENQIENGKVQAKLVTDVAVLNAIINQKPKVIYVQEKKIDSHITTQLTTR